MPSAARLMNLKKQLKIILNEKPNNIRIMNTPKLIYLQVCGECKDNDCENLGATYGVNISAGTITEDIMKKLKGDNNA